LKTGNWFLVQKNWSEFEAKRCETLEALQQVVLHTNTAIQNVFFFDVTVKCIFSQTTPVFIFCQGVETQSCKTKKLSTKKKLCGIAIWVFNTYAFLLFVCFSLEVAFRLEHFFVVLNLIYIVFTENYT
jgi:hypothetical protein